MAEQALTGLNVLEFGNGVPPCYCGKLLADLGAEVIKIEPPLVGDKTRHRAPFAGDTPGLERSGLFAYLNTNKFSITLDCESLEGKRLFKQLVERCDILVENFPPRFMHDHGLTYPELEPLNPNLVMVSITPFGQTGPHRDYKATELITYGACGYGMATTVCIEEPVMPPVKAGGRQSEFGAGQAAAAAAMCAVYARDQLGAGQYIDLSIQELMAHHHTSHPAAGVQRRLDFSDVRGGFSIRPAGGGDGESGMGQRRDLCGPLYPGGVCGCVENISHRVVDSVHKGRDFSDVSGSQDSDRTVLLLQRSG